MYKDRDEQKEANRMAAKRRRDKQKGMTQGMTKSGYDADKTEGMTEMVPPAYVPGVSGDFMMLLERPRYLTLSDGQVFDRLNPPVGKFSGTYIQEIRFCNESEFNYHPTKK